MNVSHHRRRRNLPRSIDPRHTSVAGFQKRVKITRTNWWHRHATKKKGLPRSSATARRRRFMEARRAHKAAPINIYETFEESNNGRRARNIGLIN